MPPYSAPGVYVEEVPSAIKPIAGVGTSTAGFIGVSGNITGAWNPATKAGMPVNPKGDVYTQADALVPQAINGWGQFTQKFGEVQQANQYLAHAVYGFFNNGGTRCWVNRIAAMSDTDVEKALKQFEPIDEIAMVAAPMPPAPNAQGTEAPGEAELKTHAQTLNSVHDKLLSHCENMKDRVAILDSTRDIKDDKLVVVTLKAKAAEGIYQPRASKDGYGAFYFPWIEVADPLNAGKRIVVPPSGHVAGVYARSDAERGVHKAPANEAIRGALGVRYTVSKILQEDLNPKGVDCIRSFNGTIKVYGARSVQGSDPEWIYISVRRLFNFLRESIDQGTQWVVLEPNSELLWAKIRRNVTAFLTTQWASGALFGATRQEAFYVKCDADTNPREVRELGQVVTEIGVAVVKPAEFVIFRVSQWAGTGK